MLTRRPSHLPATNSCGSSLLLIPSLLLPHSIPPHYSHFSTVCPSFCLGSAMVPKQTEDDRVFEQSRVFFSFLMTRAQLEHAETEVCRTELRRAQPDSV